MISDQVQVVIFSAHRRRQVCEVPRPRPIGCAGRMRCLLGMRPRTLSAPSAFSLSSSPKHPVEGRFRAYVELLIGRPWHDLARWQVSILSAILQVENRLWLVLAQRDRRGCANCSCACIRHHFFRLSPALQRSERQANFLACR